MARYVSGTQSSTAAAWYILTTALPAGGVPAATGGTEYHRFLLSTDDASMGLSWDTEDVKYACEEAAVTVMNSVKWEKTGVVEKIVTTANTRGKAVSDFLNGLFEAATGGSADTASYQTWIVYSDGGGAAVTDGSAKACLCTIQISSKTATAGEKRGFEFDINPVGTPVSVDIAAESVDTTTNEITATVTVHSA